MLKVENISKIEIHTDEWRQMRLAKFTSSMMHCLMGEKMLTQQGCAYLYEKVGEELTGIPAKYEVDTPETRWGLLYEPEAVRKLGEYLKVKFLVVQKLIHSVNTRFSSTPDVVIPLAKYNGGWDVETGEVKCYPSYGHYVQCALCNTPEDIYKVDKKLFWQVIDQMDNCGALRGYAALYHPEFKAGGFRVIPFRKVELTSYFKLLAERKALVETLFNDTRNKLMGIKN